MSLAELADTFRTIADETRDDIVKGSPAAALQIGRYLAYRDAQRTVERVMRERCVVPPPNLRLVNSIQPHTVCNDADCDCDCATCVAAHRE